MPSAQAILKRFNGLKTLPHVAIRLSKLISNEKSHLQEFEELIKMDPTLVLRLLRLVNSPYYGLREKVTSISRAVVFIGMKNLRNLIVLEALRDIFNSRRDSEAFSRALLWLHCAAVSVCSQMITERIFGQKGEDVFLCGILHDVGMIVEDQIEQELFAKVCSAYEPNGKRITVFEKEMIGTDHCEVASLLAREWKLPDEVRKGIKYHHTPEKEADPSSIIGTIQMAEFIVSKLKYSALPDMEPQLSPSLASHVRENIEEYRAIARDLPDEMTKAHDLYQPQEA
ncbi:MAG: HDOD domain-containing protein [Deltaproteobacteria bacterium]|nr:HDOD domain-containing protein [Deltaproteobacteria bacterium]